MARFLSFILRFFFDELNHMSQWQKRKRKESIVFMNVGGWIDVGEVEFQC